LLGEGADDRKVWIESRLRELTEVFAVSVAGFLVQQNDLHVLVRLDPGRGWTGSARAGYSAGSSLRPGSV
jgi:hypothetical protein